MTSKTKQIIMAAIGAYLVYTGISLVQDTIAGEPKNQILFILVGIFFALFGLATIIWNIRIIVKETKAEIQGTTEEAEKKVSSGKEVVDVHVGADTEEEKKPADKEEKKEAAAEEKAEDGEKEKKKAEDDTEAVKDEEKETVADKEDKKAEDVPEEKSDKKADARQEGEV